jgi:hypothetical protein
MSAPIDATTNYEDDPFLRDGSDNEIVVRLELRPNETVSTIIGFFEDSYPQPDYHIEVEPKDAIVSAALVRVDDKGEYKLVYHLQNIHDIPCKVIVRRCLN